MDVRRRRDVLAFGSVNLGLAVRQRIDRERLGLGAVHPGRAVGMPGSEIPLMTGRSVIAPLRLEHFHIEC
jgi:hypothetical protein